MQEQTKTAIFDKLSNIKHLPVSIHKNVLGNKECDKLKNLIYEYKKTKVQKMDFYEPYQDVLKISQGKGGTTQVIKVENKKDGKPINNTYVPYEKVVNIKKGETKKVVSLAGDDIDPTDVLNGEYSNLSAWCSSYHTHKKTNVFEEYQNYLASFCQKFYNDYFSENLQFQINELWIADYKKGDYAVRHNHDKFSVNFISTCYYINIEENASPIIFEGEEPIYPEKDMLIIFSSKTYHEVPPTKGKRLLISFNLESTTKHEPTMQDYQDIVNLALNN